MFKEKHLVYKETNKKKGHESSEDVERSAEMLKKYNETLKDVDEKALSQLITNHVEAWNEYAGIWNKKNPKKQLKPINIYMQTAPWKASFEGSVGQKLFWLTAQPFQLVKNAINLPRELFAKDDNSCAVGFNPKTNDIIIVNYKTGKIVLSFPAPTTKESEEKHAGVKSKFDIDTIS